MKQRFLILAMTLLAASVSSSAWASGDLEAGKGKSATCAACHGADGNSANPEWPSLAGQHPAYIAKQLAEFKSGARENALMAGQAAALTEEDMADLAVYFNAQPLTVGVASEENLALGEAIYRGGDSAKGVPACMACHGPNGVGNPEAGYPRVGSQKATYLVNQLKAFRSGQRANDEGKAMRSAVERLTDEEITAVANFISGLQ